MSEDSQMKKIADKLYKKFEESEGGMVCEYKPGYQAIATELEPTCFILSYHHGMFPAFRAETFTSRNECVKEMLRVGISWSEREIDED